MVEKEALAAQTLSSAATAITCIRHKEVWWKKRSKNPNINMQLGLTEPLRRLSYSGKQFKLYPISAKDLCLSTQHCVFHAQLITALSGCKISCLG